MNWAELNCIVDGLQALIEKYRTALTQGDLSEDDRADISNDLAYAEILRDKYEAERDRISTA